MVITVLGIPFAGLIWLAGGMKSAPQLELNEVGLASAPLLVAFTLAIISFRLVGKDHDRRPMRRRMIVVMIMAALMVFVLISTYFDMREPRFLK